MSFIFFFFFNDTATTEIYTLSLHDALPIYVEDHLRRRARLHARRAGQRFRPRDRHDRDVDQARRSEEHTSELQSPDHLVCRLLLEKKKNKTNSIAPSQPLAILLHLPLHAYT